MDSKRINLEKKTIERMIRLYCRKNHSSGNLLCEECSALHQYAFARLSNCPFGENKPVCNECEVHCYKSDMREKVKKIMRFSGPRMIFRHPYLAFMHILSKK